jgi:uncharacterized repeat protein (TIGR01451 family)
MSQARSVTATFSIFQPDLTIAKSHTGNFVQGGTGTYTLTVSNVGADPSYGTVTATDNPPASLTITGLSGTGWSCTVGTGICTRSDALASGSSYPDITVTVSVDGNAPASVTNNATVSGGGDINPNNNAASDQTTIDPQQFPLTTTVVGPGTVTSDVGGIDCTSTSGTCNQSYDNGTLVTLTATPDAYDVFVSWSGDCSGTSTTCQVTLDQARDVTATFAPPPVTHTLTVKLAGKGHGRADSNPAGIGCGSDCVETYTDGQVVTLVAKPKNKKSVFKGFTGCDTVVGNTCTVTLTSDRVVVVTFDPYLYLQLRIPNKLTLHAPYDKAKMTVHAQHNGKPLKGLKVRITVHCPGSPVTRHHGVTGKKGILHFTEARTMPNALRLLTCRVLGTGTWKHHKLKAHGRLRFIHPYWLRVASQDKNGGHVVIDVFSRPGWSFYVNVNRTKVTKTETTHKNGWVRVAVPTAGPGDLVWLTGVNHPYFSHVIILGRTPGTATVEQDHSGH